MTLYQLKPAFQRLLQPLIRGCVRAGITPNQLTTLALLLACIAGSLVIWAPLAWLLWAYPLLMLLRMALNAMDGMLARQTHQQSSFGALWNELADVLSDLVMVLPWLLRWPEYTLPIVLFCVGALLVEFAGVLALSVNAARRFDGPLGKSDRALFAALWVMAMALAAPAALMSISLVIAGLLLLLTIYNRLRHAYREAQPTGS